jgi:4-amino-4-deoxy-L-arabinose transferase-like glycosyltransferase
MGVFILILIILFLLSIPIGGIIYLIWMVRTGIKKKWKRLGLQIIAPVLLSVMLLGILNVYQKYYHAKSLDDHANYLEGIYATRIQKLPAPIYNYDSGKSLRLIHKYHDFGELV